MKFTSTRISKGNLVFRDKILIDTKKKLLSFWKRNWYGIGYQEISIRFKDVISLDIVTRKEWLLFCDIKIITRSGDNITGNGFSIKDVKRIKRILKK